MIESEENVFVEYTFASSTTTPLLSSLTSTSVAEQIAVDILDVRVYGGSARNAAWSHIRVGLWVDILEAFPGYAGAKL